MNALHYRFLIVGFLHFSAAVGALSEGHDTYPASTVPYPQNGVRTETALIGEIRFEGLQRTNPSVLLQAMDAAPGIAYTEEVREEIRRDLRSLGLFDRVRVEPDPDMVSGNRAIIEVIVRERWTLVPLPLFSANSGGTSGGLFVIENNLLGYNKQLITGGAFGTAGFNGIMVYRDPAILGSDFLGETAVTYGRSEDKAVTLKDETLAEWEATNSTARLGLGYRFGDGMTSTTFLVVQQEQFVDGRRAPGAGGTETAAYHGISIQFSDQNPMRYFNAGYVLELEGEYELGGGREREWTLAGEFSQDFPLLRDHRLRYALRAEESNRTDWRMTRLGGGETQRTIDRESVPAERYISAGLTYELPILRPDWGTITVLGFYEGGVLVRSEDTYNGAGAGFRLYLSRVTLPALGFDLAYGASREVWLFSFSIGLGM